jgi:enoyl-CoA hydratase/carnithine racemase
MTEHVTSELDQGVLRLTFDRPDKKNALSQSMYGALADGIIRVESEPDARVLHLTGNGDMFTAGNDIADFQVGATTGVETEVMRFLRKLIATDVPIVAAVNGPAIGVGVTMLLHMDFVFAASEATFRAPFIDLGLVPEAASSMLMPLQMGYRSAAAMLMMGEKFSAEQALQAGIVGEIVSQATLLERSHAAALRLARKPRQALRSTKQLMRMEPSPIAARLEVEMREFSLALKSPEAREAMSAFMEKRAPDFTKFD